MKAQNSCNHPLQYRPFDLAAMLAITAVLLLQPLPTVGASIKAMHSQGAVYVTTSATQPEHSSNFRPCPQEGWVYPRPCQKQLIVQAQRLAEKINRAYRKDRSERDLIKIVEKLKANNVATFRDAWGTDFHIEPTEMYGGGRYYQLTSAGPDKQFHTADDLVYPYLVFNPRRIVSRPVHGPSAIHVHIELNHGTFPGYAQVTGTAIDNLGTALEDATVSLEEISTGKKRTARIGSQGKLPVTALPAGKYHVTISVENIATLMADFTLAPHDRAILAAHLDTHLNIHDEIAVRGAVPVLKTDNVEVNAILDSHAFCPIPLYLLTNFEMAVVRR